MAEKQKKERRSGNPASSALLYRRRSRLCRLLFLSDYPCGHRRKKTTDRIALTPKARSAFGDIPSFLRASDAHAQISGHTPFHRRRISAACCFSLRHARLPRTWVMIILRYLIGYEYKKADFGRNKQKSVKPRYYLVNQNAILRNIDVASKLPYTIQVYGRKPDLSMKYAPLWQNFFSSHEGEAFYAFN